MGFKKISISSRLHDALAKFYQTAERYEEAWDKHASPYGNGATHLNHWDATSELVDFNTNAGGKLRNTIWDETQTLAENGVGVNLSPASLYGRVYSNQTLIPPHVDAEPMVISAVIRVSQDIKEPWIINVIDHSGKAHNLTLAEGEMLLYEGASVIHGRPYPMNGVHAAVSNILNDWTLLYIES